MVVTIADLRKLSELLLAHLERGGYSGLELTDDVYYWDVPASTRHDPYAEPKALELGKLQDDWEELRRILVGETAPIGHALVWLAAVLRRVGEKVPG